MKHIFIFFATLMSLSTLANVSDTTIVEFTEKNIKKRVVVKNSNNKSFEIPLRLNLNNLLKEMGIDSSDRAQAERWISKKLNGVDSLVIKSRNGEIVTISTKENRNNETQRNNDDRFNFEENNDQEENTTQEDEEVKTTVTVDLGRKNFFPKSDFGIYLGLNPLMGENSPELRLWQSRFVALSFRKHITLTQNDKVAVAVSYAPEIAWHNFMFLNSMGITELDGLSSVTELPFITKKSKLVMPHINLPVMLHVGSVENKLRFAVGGYVGYRIGGYAKTKNLNNNREKIRSNFGMNGLQYGLTAETGLKKGFNLFVRYSLQDLFEETQTNFTDVTPFSFGIRI